jgi:hypothetical protein
MGHDYVCRGVASALTAQQGAADRRASRIGLAPCNMALAPLAAQRQSVSQTQGPERSRY